MPSEAASSISGAIREPSPTRSRRHARCEERDGLACSNSASERSTQSMRLLVSMRQTESSRSSSVTGRMRFAGCGLARPPMRTMCASMPKDLRHSARRYSLVTIVLPPLCRPWATVRFETASRALVLSVRVAGSLNREGVSCIRSWKPRMPASVAWSAGWYPESRTWGAVAGRDLDHARSAAMRLRVPFADCQRVRGVAGNATVIGIGDDVAGEAALVQPAGQCKYAALGATELLDLGDDDRAGVGR